VLVEDDAAVERVDAGIKQRDLAEAIAALRPVEREILLLHAWAELSDAEIAGALDLPVGTVKSRLSRACARLRNQLVDVGQEPVEAR
jgi:RNA polymerase sigma-70 factor (ECF subfamily)